MQRPWKGIISMMVSQLGAMLSLLLITHHDEKHTPVFLCTATRSKEMIQGWRGEAR